MFIVDVAAIVDGLPNYGKSWEKRLPSISHPACLLLHANAGRRRMRRSSSPGNTATPA
jgi:hypothetical protein